MPTDTSLVAGGSRSGNSPTVENELTPKCNLRRFWGLAGFVLLIQFILVSYTLPITELFTGKPHFFSDNAFHWYQIRAGLNLAENGHIVGYDPYFNAGYAVGVTSGISSKGALLATIFLRNFFDEIVAYKLYVFTSAVIAPVFVCLALYWVGFDFAAIALGTSWGLLLWWTSVFRWYHTNGMVSFVFAAYLALLYYVAVQKYLLSWPTWPALPILTVVSALAFLHHPFFPIPVAVATMVSLVVFRHSIQFKKLLGLVLVGTFAVLVNQFWIQPTRLYSVAKDFRVAYQSFVDINILWQELLGRWAGHAQGSKQYGLLALSSLWAWILVKGPVYRKIVRATVITGAFLIIFAAIGAAVPGLDKLLQPNRFAPVGYLFLIVPSTLGFVELSKAWMPFTRSIRRSLATLSFVTVALASVYLANELRREISYADIPHYGARPPEIKGLGDYSRWLIDCLQAHTSKDGRVLFETSRARIYDGSRMAGYYAYTADREFIGGPYPYMHFAGFWDGWLFDKPITSISRQQFASYMELYNVGWIVAHSEDTRHYLESYSDAVPVAGFRQLRVYRLARDLNYFIAGSGHVTQRGHNEIVLSDLSGPAVAVKYHLLPGLKTEPPTSIVPLEMMDDPVPFIKIINPPKQVRLSLP